MKRTTQALRRFGVPVLAATTLLSFGQVALGTSSFAATGTLTVTPNPGFASATPETAGDNTITNSVRYTQGQTTSQTITVTVSGSATINTTGITQPTGNSMTVAAGGKSATCTTSTTGTEGCDFNVTDTVSEAVTVTATDTTDNTVGPATATDNFSSLFFSNCSTSAQQTEANCVSQVTNGQSQTYTITYMQAGAAAAGVGLTFELENSLGGVPSNHTIFTTPQPSGTTFTGPSNTATCVTNAQGQCQVSVTGTSIGNGDILDAVTSTNTGSYPASEADQTINVIASTVAGRLDLISSTPIRPTGAPAANEPGDAIQNVYELDSCQANTTTGKNACLEGNALSGVSVALTVDHGFFTPNCVGGAGANDYANCTFNTTPAAGAKVGDLKSSGTSMTVTTGTNGRFTVTLGIAKDAGFDDDGSVAAVVKGVANGVTLTESVPGQTNTASTCPSTTPGCPTNTLWTTDAAPLNGGTVSIVWLSKPALSKTATNEVPDNPNGSGSPVNVFVLHGTDQFGNLTSTDGAIDLVSSGGGELGECGSYQDTTAHSDCDDATDPGSTGTVSQPNGVTTFTINGADGSYTQVFDVNGDPSQERYWVWADTDETGTQTLTASWDAPITTFLTFTAGTSTTNAVATYDTTKTNTVTDKTVIDYYAQVPTTFTFSSTPSNRVRAGTVVTVSATVKDQKGKGIANENVQFIRSGPTTEAGNSCTGTQSFPTTNDNGQAGFSFTCTNPSTQVVTIIVTDNSGNELARSTQTIHFTGKVHITASINCFSPRKHQVTCKVHVSPKFKGLTVVFFNAKGHRIGSDDTNRHGNAFLHKKGMKSGKHHTYSAHVRHSSRTFGTDAGSDGVTVK